MSVRYLDRTGIKLARDNVAGRDPARDAMALKALDDGIGYNGIGNCWRLGFAERPLRGGQFPWLEVRLWPGGACRYLFAQDPGVTTASDLSCPPRASAFRQRTVQTTSAARSGTVIPSCP